MGFGQRDRIRGFTKSARRFVAALGLLPLLTACSGDPFIWTATQNSITGMVVPLNPVVTLAGGSLRGRSAASLSAVCPTAKASLYSLDTSGTRVLPALQTTSVKADGSYTFADIRNNGIVAKKINQLSDNYVVEVTGCNAAYARILTATNKQDIDWGTTLVAYVTGTSQAADAKTAPRENLNAMYAALSTSGTFPAAYTALSSPTLAAQFQQNFGAPPAVLEDASPMLVEIDVPAAMREGDTSALTLTAVQWKSAYPRAYRWEFDGVPFAHTTNASFKPGANDQGFHMITVSWGQDDGFGDIDPLKPYRQRSFAVQIADAIAPTPPSFVALPPNVNTPAINLRMNTGASLANCASFSNLAITEDSPVAPLDPTQYTITCAQSPIQDFSYMLSGGVGTHTLYLWARDASGTISGTPQSTTVNYSNAVPNITITAPLTTDAPYISGTTVQGACDASSGDVTLTGNITGAPLLAACSAGTYSHAITFSGTDGSKTITVAQTNAFGTTATASVSVTKDATAPTVTLTSPASADTALPFVVTMLFSERVTGFDSTKPVVTNGTLSGFTGSGTTYTATITPSGQGTVNVTVPSLVAFDAAGNGNTGGSLSRNFDTVAPTVVISVATNPTNLTSVPVTVTFSEPVLGFALGSIAVTNGTASTLTGSGTSYTFNVAPTAQGNFTVQVGAGAAHDSAGNNSLASNLLSITFDTVAPTATLTTSVLSPTKVTPFPMTLTFSEAVTGFALSDLTLVNATAANLLGSGTTYTFNVIPSAQGLVEITLPASSANDAAGNGNAVSNTISKIFDSTAPNLNITSPSSSFGTNQNHVIFTGACEGSLPISITGTGLSTPSSATCASGTYSVDIFFTAGEGIKNISLEQTDLAGNQTVVSRAVPFDTIVPALTFTSAAIKDQITNTNTATFSGACEAGTNVVVAGGVDTGTAPCTGSAWTYTTASQSSDALRTYTFTQTDPGGNAASITGTWRRDTVVPALTRVSPADGTHAKAFVTITGACETGVDVFFTGVGLIAPLQIACSAGTYSQDAFFTNGDGTKAITIRQTDLGGNATTINASFERDNAPPVLTQTLRASPYWTNTNSATFGGACESGLSIAVTVDGVAEGSAPCAAGTWTYPTGNQTVDGVRTYSFIQTDTANNSTTVSAQWVRRTTIPALAFSSASTFSTSTNTVTYYGTCTTGMLVQITGADTSSTPCNGSSWSYTTAAQTTDATRTYNFRQTDPAGNTVGIAGTWTRNTNLPKLTVTSTNPFYSNGNTTTFTGGCSNGMAITLTGAESSTITCSSGTWSFNANQSTDGTYDYSFNQNDGIGNSTTVLARWVRDTTGPTITSLQLNGGAAVTNTSYVKASLSGSDSLTKVLKFCLKASPAAPASGDSCWIPVNATPPGLTPALTINMSNYSHLLGVTPGNYSVYAWLQDAAGNISTNAAAVGTDRANIDYQLIYPPVLDTVFATNTASPGFPVPSPQLSVGAGGTIYIKWRATTMHAFGGTPITLSFTNDDINWNTIATVSNAANGGCVLHTSSADAAATGCYNWSAPTGGFIRVRIEAEDTGGRNTEVSPAPLNTGTFKLIAGNTEPGIDNSTLSSVYTFRSKSFKDWTEINAFALNSSGVMFINDFQNGVLRIDPADGLTRVLLPKTGTTSPDGPVNSATVRNPLGITIDYQDRLIVWDNDRIRRIDFTTNTITTIIGGGTGGATTGTDISDNIADARNLAFEGYMPLPVIPDSEMNWRTARVQMIPLPNGDLYFGSWLSPWIDAQHKFRRYREGAGYEIVRLMPTGYGHSGGTGADLTKCAVTTMGFAFDPASSQINTVSLAVSDHYLSTTTFCMPDGSHAPVNTHYLYEAQLDANWVAKAVQPPQGEVANVWAHYQRITGRDGKLYAIRRTPGRAYRWDPVGNSWIPILGNGYQGQCADGTLASACENSIQDAFVTPQGQFFFLDNGRIRTIDSAGKVVSVFGQALNSGDGADPVLARFKDLWSIALESDGRVLVFDDNLIREVSADRSVVTKIAGTGRHDRAKVGDTAATSPMLNGGEWHHNIMIVDPATNDIFFPIIDTSGRSVIGRLQRSTGIWTKAFGAGTTPVFSGDGLSGDQVTLGMYGDEVSPWIDGYQAVGLGSNGKMLLSSAGYPNSTVNWKNPNLKTYNSADSWRQQHLLGKMGVSTVNNEYCADGTDVNNCDGPVMYQTGRAQYDSVDKKWLLLSNRGDTFSSTRIRYVFDNDGLGTPRTIQTFVTLPRVAASFDYWRTGGHEYIYYCSYTGDLYRYDVTSTAEVQLTLPASSMKCLPQTSIQLDRTNAVLYFNFKKSGLHGIGSVSAI